MNHDAWSTPARTLARTRRLPILLALALGLGCQTTGRTIALPEAQPPLANVVAPPSYLTPRSQHYRVAVRSFVDQTGQAAEFTEVAADVLVTALHARERFSLYDVRELPQGSLPAVASPAPAGPAGPAESAGAAASTTSGAPGVRGDVYEQLQGVVDGVLESYVTAIRVDKQGTGHFEVDYRIVDPYSRMVVTSGNARIGLSGGAVVRKDFERMAIAASRPFIDPGVMAQHDIEVRELDLDGREVRLTLSGGSNEQVERGFVGFVVEQDQHARVDRYLAKFVVVNVFPEASVGVVVAHCNAVGRCSDTEAIKPVEQAQSVHAGAKVLFK
jgi:hypothetical protein